METIQGLTGKNYTRSNLREVSHTFFGRSTSGFDSELQKNIEFVKYVVSSMEFWPAVTLKVWKYLKGGSVQRNLNCALDAWVRVT